MDHVASLPAAKSALDAPSDASLRVPCYCEENVWRLAFRKLSQRRQPRPDASTEVGQAYDTALYAVFVSNPKGCVPMFQQQASTHRERPVFWDYHVILLQETKGTDTKESRPVLPLNASCSNVDGYVVVQDQPDDGVNVDPSPTTRRTTSALVWDIDSHLICPCPLPDYLKKVFPNDESWPGEYTPYFRVVNAETYLRHFSSDRSHMYNGTTGEWNATPPPYDCIIRSNRDANCDGREGLQEAGASSSSGHRQCDTAIRHQNTLEQYMTITQIDVDRQQQEQRHNERGPNQIEGSIGSDDTSSSSTPFGRIYSLSQLRKRFCPVDG